MRKVNFQQKYETSYKNIQYTIEVRDIHHIFVNGFECTNKMYDERTKSIYAVIPVENESVLLIIQKKECFIFDYDSKLSLLKNGHKHILIDMNKLSKIISIIFFFGSILAIYLTFGENPNSWIFTIGLAAFYFTGTIAYTTLIKKPSENDRKKCIIFMLCHSILSIITITCGFLLFIIQ